MAILAGSGIVLVIAADFFLFWIGLAFDGRPVLTTLSLLGLAAIPLSGAYGSSRIGGAPLRWMNAGLALLATAAVLAVIARGLLMAGTAYAAPTEWIFVALGALLALLLALGAWLSRFPRRTLPPDAPA